MIVAIGGNAFVKENGLDSVQDQYEAVKETVVQIAEMVQAGYNVVVKDAINEKAGTHRVK